MPFRREYIYLRQTNASRLIKVTQKMVKRRLTVNPGSSVMDVSFGLIAGRLVRERLADVLNHLFGVSQKHHRLIHVEHIIINTSIANPTH